MRIWDLQPSLLCRQHLLGEHRELHAIWNIITFNCITGETLQLYYWNCICNVQLTKKEYLKMIKELI